MPDLFIVSLLSLIKNFLNMKTNAIPPIDVFRDQVSKEKGNGQRKKPTDTKIEGVVLEKIASQSGALLQAVAAPKTVINLMSILAMGERGKEVEIAPILPEKKKRIRSQKKKGRVAPLGLKRCKSHDWVNALMQFLLFLPQGSDLFSFVPRAFEPFREFVDQYFADQEENQEVSSANGSLLIRPMVRTLPQSLFLDANAVDLYEVVRLLMETLFPQYELLQWSASNSVLLHPKRHLVWDPKGPLSWDKAIQEKVEANFPDLLVAVKGGEVTGPRVVKKQLLSANGKHLYYDLDAFIEHRVDFEGQATYVAYVKVGGVWYQCDDERITHLLSTTLNAPLHRSVLLHYQKVSL